MAQLVKNLPAVQETQVQSLGQEDSLEKEMATHSSTLAWRIPWTEEPGKLQSTGLQRVGCDCVTNFLLLQSTGFRVQRLQQLQLTGSRAWAQELWHAGLVALWHVGSSWIRDRTCVSCIGRWILYH